ncbi:PoNe immunity protein domain-containing protein [Listeria booriae]|uniref:DUF1911 domain-containing protein n=1 Tax=Listeria booriae TaxID=1552123 RepID=A0A7X0XT83_9LIST|nr:PoNe immunity protein domain-containing protein [Listeria booriae]MBC1779660.1 DUF1911 domain-containing protein [Listeria booriae]
MRDTIKDTVYFEKYFKENQRQMEKYQGMVLKIKEEFGVNDNRVRTGNIILLNNYIDGINCLYSMGADINKITYIYPKFIDVLNQIWNKETSSYIQLLWAVSLGVLLESNEEIELLSNLVKREELNDYLIEYLLHYQNLDSKETTPEFKYPSPYKALDKVIHAENEETAVNNLKLYIENEWYNGHNNASWYNSHKSKHDIYSGYWSYESGAIAKILKLDDKELENLSYYPYDLVHYKNY